MSLDNIYTLASKLAICIVAVGFNNNRMKRKMSSQGKFFGVELTIAFTPLTSPFQISKPKLPLSSEVTASIGGLFLLRGEQEHVKIRERSWIFSPSLLSRIIDPVKTLTKLLEILGPLALALADKRRIAREDTEYLKIKQRNTSFNSNLWPGFLFVCIYRCN